MKKNAFYRIAVLMMALLLLLPILTLPLYAEEKDPGTDLPSGKKNLPQKSADELVLFDFESDAKGWKTTGEGGSVAVGRDPLADPSLPDGECAHCLTVHCDEWFADYSLGVGYSFETPVDLAGWHTYEMSVLLPEGEEELGYVFQVRLTFDDQNTVEESFAITVGEWNTISLSLSEITTSLVLTGVDFLLLASDAEAAEITSFSLGRLRLTEPIDFDLTERFLFDRFSVGNAEAAFNEEKNALVLTLSGEEAILSPILTAPIVTGQTCLRFRIKNDSNCDQMTLFYTVRTRTGTLETQSKTLRLERQSAASYYDAEIGDLSALCGMECHFRDAVGKVTITSIRPCEPYYADAYATCGSLSSCRLDDDLSTISFVGDVSREAALANADGSIKIFRLQAKEDARSFSPAEHKPIAEGPMSTRFSLTYDITEDETAIFDRYAAYLVSHDQYALIAPAFYVANPDAVADKNESGNTVALPGKKGLIASDLSLIGESGAGQTVIELNAVELFAPSENAIAETILGETCLWNRKAVETLDRKWEALTCAGVSCLFEITGTDEKLPVKRPFEILCLFAAARYGAEGGGGLIVGESANTQRGSETLKKRVSESVKELRSAYQVITSVNPSLCLYLSVSNLISDEMALTDAWGLDEFLPALSSELASEDRFGWRLCLSCEEEQTDECVDAFDHSLLTVILDRLGLSDRHLLFIDRRFSRLGSQRETESLYVSNLLSACFDRQIDGYLVDFDVVSPGMSHEIVLSALMAKTPETFEKLSGTVLQFLGVSDWSSLLARYEPDGLPVCRETEGVLLEKLPAKVRGLFAYYAFDSYSAEADLEPCYYTAELSIDKSRDSLLCAKLNRTVYGSDEPVSRLGFGHRYRYAEDFSLTPIVSVTLMADAPLPIDLKTVDLEIIFCSGNDFYVLSSPLTVGELTTLTFDLSQFPDKANIDAFRFLVNGKELKSLNLRLQSVVGYSTELDSDDLSEAISAERQKRRKIEKQKVGSKRTLWIALGTVGALTVLTAALLSIPHEEVPENNENEEN